MTKFRQDPGPRLSGLLVLATAATACGGLTSGSGKHTTGVAIALVSPAAIQVRAAATIPLPDTRIAGRLSGDLKLLDGKTVYVRIDDPAGLFQPLVSLRHDEADVYSLLLRGNPLAGVGRLTGLLRIHVSLDPDGNEPFEGSPLQIPYDVSVLPGLTVESDAITIEAKFGTATVIRNILATPLDDAVLKATLEQDGESSWAPAVTVPDASIIRLTFPAAPPGTYHYTLDAIAAFYTSNGSYYRFIKPITVTYVVTPDPAPDYVFSPPQVSMAIARSMPSGYVEYSVLLANAGVTRTSAAPVVEYLSHPTEADGNPFVQKWLTLVGPSPGTSGAYSWWRVGLEFFASSYSDTLPVGTYTARVSFTLQKAGIDQVVSLPIEFNVTHNE